MFPSGTIRGRTTDMTNILEEPHLILIITPIYLYINDCYTNNAIVPKNNILLHSARKIQTGTDKKHKLQKIISFSCFKLSHGGKNANNY